MGGYRHEQGSPYKTMQYGYRDNTLFMTHPTMTKTLAIVHQWHANGQSQLVSLLFPGRVALSFELGHWRNYLFTMATGVTIPLSREKKQIKGTMALAI